MKLVNKFALWYLAITTLVLLIGGLIVFKSVQRENDEEEVRRIRGLMNDVVDLLASGAAFDSLQTAQVAIEKLDYALPLVPFHVKDTMGWHSEFQETERQIQATASFKVANNHCLISVRTFASEPEETMAGVIQSLSWIFVLLILVVGLTSILVSKKILLPFNQSLKVMQRFNVKQKEQIKLPDTKTKEFKALNKFLLTMTSKALDDYRALKEFTENASHELQTPLAIIRGKLELLLESGISDDQAKLIMSAHEAVEKLSKTNQSLTLLTKLENQEFEPVEIVNLSTRVQNIISSLAELMEMKAIFLETDVDENVMVSVHHTLADILLMNLFSNAIRHNREKGIIKVKLTKHALLIQNTGEPPSIPTDQLFLRFKKGNQSSDSIGLGLSIVKRICEVSHFNIHYTYLEPIHSIAIEFQANSN
jgi:signal transduction histidine kinase